MSACRPCKCGCGMAIPYTRRYVDKAHQLGHMRSGEARRMNGLQPTDAKRRGGKTAGRRAAESGGLTLRGLRGAQTVRRVAEHLREQAESA